MDFGQWLPIHLPSKHDLMDAYFSIRDGYHVIVHLALLEIRVNAHELDMFGIFFQTTTIFEDFLKTDTSPPCSANCALSPSFPTSAV